MKPATFLATLCLLALAAPALGEEAAKPAAPRAVSVLGAAPVGPGRNVFLAEVGWPGLGLTFMHGQSGQLDLGAALGFNFLFEGVPVVAPGFKLNIVARLNLVNQANLNVGVRASPGFVAYFPDDRSTWDLFYDYRGRSSVGLTLPLELVAGIPISRELSAHLGFAVPLAVLFTPEVYFAFPLQAGGGLEYRVSGDLALTFDARFGSTILFVPGDNRAWFSSRILMGIAYTF